MRLAERRIENSRGLFHCAAAQRVLENRILTVPSLLECSRGGLMRTGSGDAHGLAKPGAGGAVNLRVGLGVSTAFATQHFLVPLGTTQLLAGGITRSLIATWHGWKRWR